MDLSTFLKSLFGVNGFSYKDVNTDTKIKFGWYVNHILSKKFYLQTKSLESLPPDLLSDSWYAILGHIKQVPPFFYTSQSKSNISDEQNQILINNDIESTPFLKENFFLIKDDIDKEILSNKKNEKMIKKKIK